MVAHLVFANNASSRLYQDTPANTTSIRVAAGDGAKFPQPSGGDTFMVTLEDRRNGQIEIGLCTARSGDILTVTRGQEGTTAQAFVMGATVSNRLTAGTLAVLISAAGVPEAPADGKIYGRQDTNWIETLSKLTIDAQLLLKAPLASPTFTGNPQAPTPAPDDNDQSIATTAFVRAGQDAQDAAIIAALALKAPINSPVLTGDPQAPTPAPGDSDTSIATTAFVSSAIAADITPWSEITGKPATFPPTLPIASADVTGLDAKQTSQDAAIATKIGPEAPTDGKQYARKNSSWAEIVIPASGIPEAPNDGITYGRKSLAWAPVVGGAVIADAAPPGPLQAGQLWWESDTGNLFIWYDDGNTTQWVQTNGQVAGNAIQARIADTSADMAWLFRPASWLAAGSLAHAALNEKADGSGADVFRINDLGDVINNGPIILRAFKTDNWAIERATLVLNPGTTATNESLALTLANDVGALCGALNFGPAVNWGGSNGVALNITNGAGTDASSYLFINKGSDAGAAALAFKQSNQFRWLWNLEGAAATLVLQSYSLAGAYKFPVLTAYREGDAGFGGVGGHLTVRGGLSASGIAADDSYSYITAHSTGIAAYLSFQGPGYDVGWTVRNVVGGTATLMYWIYYTTPVGSISTNGSATAYNTTSDARLKANMRSANGDARALVDAIEVVSYTPLEPAGTPEEGHRRVDRFETFEEVVPPEDPVFMGIPAQQAYTIYPAAVTPPLDMAGYNAKAQYGDEDFKPWMIDYSKFVPMLMANTQDNNARLDELEARLQALEAA